MEGNGFLYKQVRHLVGAMLTAGRGRLTLDAISSALQLGSARPPGARGADGRPAASHLAQCMTPSTSQETHSDMFAKIHA